VEGQATISSEILASYAADAVREAPGVRALVEGRVPGRRGVRILDEERQLRIEIHLAVEWGASIPEVGRDVQRRVREYLLRMADVDPILVDVVVDELGPRVDG
jgi:uncharacterized alkaline shock family protein YloU